MIPARDRDGYREAIGVLPVVAKRGQGHSGPGAGILQSLPDGVVQLPVIGPGEHLRIGLLAVIFPAPQDGKSR